MARRVFFSFHFERDAWRSGQVRNCWLTKPDRESAGYWDAAKWEEVKTKGDQAIKNWINNSLSGTSVTVVLIGAETSERVWVKYEISESYKRGNGILGIYIHNIKNSSSLADTKGDNPLSDLYITKDDRKIYLSELYFTYDWVNDNGYENIGDWVKKAADNAGR